MQSKFELFVTRPKESARFYAALGFEIVHCKDDGYTSVRSGEVVVALSPVPDWLPLRWFRWLRRPPLGTEIVLYTAELSDLHRALKAAGYEPGPIRKQPWGDVDFRLTDPDGYYLRLTEGTPIPAGEHG